MSRNLALTAPFALLFGGCAAMEGLWLLTLKPRPVGDLVQTCDENFFDGTCVEEWDTGGYFPGDDTWDRERVDDPADLVVLGQVIMVRDGQASMMLGGRFLTGEIVDGSWVLAYDAEDARGFEETHPAGYGHTEGEVWSEHHRIGLGPLERGVRKGKLTSTLAYDGSWTESDEWDRGEVGRYGSALPWWLIGTGGYYGSTQNGPTRDDCDGAVCTVGVTQELEYVWDVEAREVRTSDPDDVILDASDGFQLPRP